ncbi:Hypothetical protein Eab7_1868 [Exiguobacterium antarcticum B7]|nr:Hypothetical protein Eab7_1868 [Exiguobacterium antarcticum B7]
MCLFLMFDVTNCSHILVIYFTKRSKTVPFHKMKALYPFFHE